MAQPDSKVLVLGALAGVAGISLAVVCYQGFKSKRRASCPGLYLSRTNDSQRAGLMVVDGPGLQTGQAEVLERLEALIKCVSELKDEMKSLKNALPVLQDHVREELRGHGETRRASPHYRTTPTRRKRAPGTLTEPRPGGPSSEEAESEGGYAIMCGIMAEYDTVQNKIKNGYIFKDHLDKAIELKPQDPMSYYLLGRWCYAVAQLSWIERKVAATLFGEPPSATVADALRNFLKVEEIQPGYSKFNYVFLAKCYKDLGQNQKARSMCEAACSMTTVSKEDEEAQKELDSLCPALGV